MEAGNGETAGGLFKNQVHIIPFSKEKKVSFWKIAMATSFFGRFDETFGDLAGFL